MKKILLVALITASAGAVWADKKTKGPEFKSAALQEAYAKLFTELKFNHLYLGKTDDGKTCGLTTFKHKEKLVFDGKKLPAYATVEMDVVEPTNSDCQSVAELKKGWCFGLPEMTASYRVDEFKWAGNQSEKRAYMEDWQFGDSGKFVETNDLRLRRDENGRLTRAEMRTEKTYEDEAEPYDQGHVICNF